MSSDHSVSLEDMSSGVRVRFRSYAGSVVVCESSTWSWPPHSPHQQGRRRETQQHWVSELQRSEIRKINHSFPIVSLQFNSKSRGKVPRRLILCEIVWELCVNDRCLCSTLMLLMCIFMLFGVSKSSQRNDWSYALSFRILSLDCRLSACYE